MCSLSSLSELSRSRAHPDVRARRVDRRYLVGVGNSPRLKISDNGRLVLLSLLAGLAVLGLMLATEPKLVIVWDEGYTLGREARLRQWFSALRDPVGFAARWQPPTIDLVQQVRAPPPQADQI